MDNKREVSEFLRSRRARITPEHAGLPAYGTNRRVPGLRREEVAMLAGVSVDYYTRLERGNLRGASESVLDALVAALQLDEAERAHLFNLARVASSRPAHQGRTATSVRPELQRILDAMPGVPACIGNARLDQLAANELGRALYAPIYGMGPEPPNSVRFVFLDPKAREFWVDWETIAHDLVATLHAAAVRDPNDRRLTALVGEVCTKSEEFRRMWASQDVHLHRRGRKRINHPEVGLIELSYEALTLAADPSLRLVVYLADQGSRSEEALSLLATWAATEAAHGAAVEPHRAPRGPAVRPDHNG